MRNTAFGLLCSAIVGCCAVSFPSAALADGLKVELSSSQGSIRVIVINTSNQSIRTNTRLANGPDIGLWELYLEVRDMHGRQKEYSAKAAIGPPQESDWQNLLPQHFVGTQISFEWLALDYDLDKGPYDVTADYRITSGDGRVLESYRSNSVRIMIESDGNQHAARLKEKGELYDVDLDAIKKKARSKSEPAQ